MALARRKALTYYHEGVASVPERYQGVAHLPLETYKANLGLLHQCAWVEQKRDILSKPALDSNGQPVLDVTGTPYQILDIPLHPDGGPPLILLRPEYSTALAHAKRWFNGDAEELPTVFEPDDISWRHSFEDDVEEANENSEQDNKVTGREVWMQDKLQLAAQGKTL
ncbi:hypothetical protein Moror_14112 [Moniliophthora roreri MCA 2997]|uniref:Uncharacterized protein n=1 Tax=Moniliophthora roreri (strain MCA 2997) TaxID=1381753 RepID=V2YT52_MONRO|nr:hypothetical protein Moror_14112 [Moniliophthora roreri MCA 2997]